MKDSVKESVKKPGSAVEAGSAKKGGSSSARQAPKKQPRLEGPDGRDLGELEKSLGYSFENRKFLWDALIHKSYANERKLPDTVANERLEFLGDAVLELVVSQAIMERFPNYSEGELSKLRASIVNEHNLARLARRLRLGEFLFLGKGEARSGGREKASILADAYEAVLAAVYLDGELPAAELVGRAHFQSIFKKIQVEGYDHDFKTLLQERCQAVFKVTPEYRVVEATGPDHQKEFTVALSIAGKPWAEGRGRTKKEAEQRAAAQAYARLTGGPKSAEEG
jgi:ribonuclease-3